MKVLASDFDGVLHDWHTAQPIEGAAVALRRLNRRGWRIVVFTTNQVGYVWKWLDEQKLARYVHDVTNAKPRADVYLDDKGLKFESWDQAYSALRSL